jgi:4-amino-4-deoxy-L-arabinose transferase-like glycosyltransferase
MAKRKKIKKGRNRDLFKAFMGMGPFNLTAVSLLIAVAGQFFLYNLKMAVPGIILFGIAAVIFIIADTAGGKIDERSITPLMEISLFLFIIAVAVFYRTWMIDQLPAGCYRDEGQNGNEAINIMQGLEVDGTKLPVYIERWTQNAAMYMYFIAASFKFLGIGVLQIRAVSVVLGVLCIPAFYFLARQLFGVRIALMGAFLMAVTRWHVNFSRIGFLGILTVFFVIACMYFAYRVYRKRGALDFAMLGILTAMSLYTYLAGRLIPVGFVIFLLFILVTESRFYTKNFKPILLGLFCFLVTAAPLGIYALQHPQNFMSRSSTVSIFNQEMLHEVGGRYVEKDGTPKSGIKLYIENVWYTLMMFNYKGDGNPRHNFHDQPMLDFISGIFYVLGILYALYHFRKPRYFLLLALFAAFLQAGLLSTESPQAYRTIVEIPVVLIFILIALEKIFSRAYAQYGKKILMPLTISAAIMFAVIAVNNYLLYFDKWANNPGSWAEFSTDEYSMGRYLHDLGPDWTGVVSPAWAESYAFRFAVYPYNNYTVFNPSEWIPITDKSRKNFVYILDDAYLPLVSLLHKMYPEGKYGEYRHKFFNSNILYFTYEVPYEAVKRYQDKPKKNGLKGAYYRGIDWKGEPAFSTLDPFILFNWTRDPVLGPFSVKWTGRIRIEKPGTYTFMTVSNDFSDLYIDGSRVIDNPGFAKGPESTKAEVKLSAGFHSVVLRYHESIHYSKMQFWWRPPFQDDMEVVPSEVLYP